MNIRLDIDNPTGKQSVLIGVWLEGFGWVKGGVRNGTMKLTAGITPDQLTPGILGNSIKRRAQMLTWLRQVKKTRQSCSGQSTINGKIAE